MKKAALWLVNIIVFLVFLSTSAMASPIQVETTAGLVRPEGMPELKAASAILTDSENGQILFEQNSRVKLHIAPLCKLMTILIAVETGDPNSNVTISKDSVDANGSALNLVVGEKYSLEELTYGIMLSSANDAAISVAEYIAGDTETFVKKMNEMAQKLSMKDTNFINPTGLYDENQYTTANDIMLFIKYAIKNPTFNRIFAAQMRPWNNPTGTSMILTSQNKLFWSYDGVDGGKTGFNSKEQQTVISTATHGNLRLINVVLDSPEKELFNDAAAIYEYGFNKYRKSILVRKNELLKTVEYQGNEISLISSDDYYYIHPSGEDYIRQYTVTTDLQPPISKTKIAGNAKYLLEDGTEINVGLYPLNEIVPPEDFFSIARKKIEENKDIFYLVLFLLAIEAIMIIVNIIKLIGRLIRKITSNK